MLKAEAAGSATRRQPPSQQAEMPDHVQGRIEEMCHELAIQVKRMRQLQDQADELRTVIREWAASPRRVATNQLIVEDDAEK